MDGGPGVVHRGVPEAPEVGGEQRWIPLLRGLLVVAQKRLDAVFTNEISDEGASLGVALFDVAGSATAPSQGRSATFTGKSAPQAIASAIPSARNGIGLRCLRIRIGVVELMRVGECGRVDLQVLLQMHAPSSASPQAALTCSGESQSS